MSTCAARIVGNYVLQTTYCATSTLVCGMAIARTALELQRWNNLVAIRGMLAVRMRDFCDQNIGLSQIAELCRRQVLARPGRDWVLVRNQILRIGCDWDLDNDRLDKQSDDCLDHIASFLSD